MNKKRSLLERDGVLTIITSVLCVILGLLVGFLAVLIINPQGAFGAITGVVENFFAYSSSRLRIYNFGSTLAKTAPLIMCSLSVLFAYKVGLFNIGAAGQYALGAGAAIYSAYCLQLPWYVCLLLGILVGGISGALGGILKAFCNVNVVISGIMLNWISLYGVNVLLKPAMDPSGKDTFRLLKRRRIPSFRTLAWTSCLRTTNMSALRSPLPLSWRSSSGSFWTRPSLAMSSRLPVTTPMPPSTAA